MVRPLGQLETEGQVLSRRLVNSIADVNNDMVNAWNRH
jgi:hypothetical protein